MVSKLNHFVPNLNKIQKMFGYFDLLSLNLYFYYCGKTYKTDEISLKEIRNNVFPLSTNFISFV